MQTKTNAALVAFAEEVGVELDLREEYTVARGRADAVYNRVIIEYEAPGSLRSDLSHGRTKHAVRQVQDYLDGVAKREHFDKERLLGVAFDGKYVVFVRWRDARWDVEPPLEWNKHAAARLLRSVVSLSSGRALIPENLVDDFGRGSQVSLKAARALYDSIGGHKEDLVAALFEQWRLFYSEVSGFEEVGSQLKKKKELREFAKGMGLRASSVDPARLFFAMHTYFCFLAKAIAKLVLDRHAVGPLGATPLTVWANLSDEGLRHELERLEQGGIFAEMGFGNLLEGDFFSWYLHAWSEPLADAFRDAIAKLSEYNPATIEENPFAARDLLKMLYHHLMPREVRHDLGEYYTPDWLAQYVLRALGEPLFTTPTARVEPDLRKRLLDPACGSGTFLVLAIRAIKEHAARLGLSEADTLELILHGVVGIDLNPLAVLAARVSYLLAISDLLPFRRSEVSIPVYLADSVATPTTGTSLFGWTLETAVGEFTVPQAVNSREQLEALTHLLHQYIRGGLGRDAFVESAVKELSVTSAEDVTALQLLFDITQRLEDEGKNGIWARVLKNAFMPLFIGTFDYVAGNPPWVNWESLPESYRSKTSPLWNFYGLFVHTGMEVILGKGKKDISALMTYAALDRFLAPGGRLAFLITQSVFKSSGAGQGFRSFSLPDKTPLQVVRVDDMSELRPFEGASNRTTLMVLQKGSGTRYPVPYVLWKKSVGGKPFGQTASLEDVLAATKRLDLVGAPVSTSDLTSSWLTCRERAVPAVRRLVGKSDYVAHAGVYSGGANGVYWVEVLEELPDKSLLVRNVRDETKVEVQEVTAAIEPDYVYPLLRSRDVLRWHAEPSGHILFVQDPKTRKGVDEEMLKRQCPKTYAYLKEFEDVLRSRAAFKRYYKKTVKKVKVDSGPFYSMFDVGPYTMSEYKVVWPNMGADLRAAVVSPTEEGKVVLPQHVVTLVALDNVMEAFFVAGCVNSLPFQYAVHSFSQSGGKSFGTPQLLEHLRIPRFQQNDSAHGSIAKTAELATRGTRDIEDLESQLEHLAADLWGISTSGLQSLRAAFKELQAARA